MSSRYSLKRDLDELERMVARLGDYLLGNEMYLSIGGGAFRGLSAPQLTIGALLLRRRRLTQLRAKLKRADGIRLDAALADHDDLQREWTLHYEQKLQREVPSRLRVMAGFFRECSENPRDCAGAYPIEALRRTIVGEILLAMMEFGYEKSEVIASVRSADQALRRILQAGEFIWSPLLAPVYPQDDFWWLYGRPAA
ncbi:MAG: hypothetical protein OXI77_18770 [Chloroflexota bacterium]|nr:hypothetical protein [Chloroflexota bacterium]MDE2907984.1 hypothetical protein [Chloroflexota bacterium]